MSLRNTVGYSKRLKSTIYLPGTEPGRNPPDHYNFNFLSQESKIKAQAQLAQLKECVQFMFNWIGPSFSLEE